MRYLISALVVLALTATDAEAARRHHTPTAQSVPHKDEGPDLPYSCTTIRFNAWLRGFKRPLTPDMRRQIAELEKAHGITPKQHRQAEACFKT